MSSMNKPKDESAFLAEARERYAYALSVDAEDRAEAREDVRFKAATPVEGGGSTQWTDEAVRARKACNRPILTENRLHIYTAQVVNDGRQSKPSIKVTALDGSDKKTAEALQSRIRHIEYESDADIAYDTAREQQVTSGRGFYRISTYYPDAKSIRQELRIEPILDQFSVIFDPGARKYDKSDADYCFVVEVVQKEEYVRRYGQEAWDKRSDFVSEKHAAEWTLAEGNAALVAEYWHKEHKTRKLVQLVDGSAAFKDELSPELQAYITQELRDVDACTVWQSVIDGSQELDRTKWIGTQIPIVPQFGRVEFVDGKVRTYSLIRNAKDPQRLVNVYVSNIAEQCSLLPKNPYHAPLPSIAGLEHIWERINEEPMAVVPYHQYDSSGRELRPPTREVAEPPIQALVVGLNQAIDAIKASMGIFDASLGARSNENSGIAIQRRQKESDNANFHFHDNEARSRKYAGRILLELIPIVDAGKDSVALREEDGKTRVAKWNEPYQDPETGETVHHDLSGDFGVAISTGPSYTSARQEAYDMYSQIAQADPRFMQIAGHVLFRNLDAPGSEEIADLYEKMLPPQLQKQEGPQAQIPPQVIQMVQQKSQEADQYKQFAMSLHEQIQSKLPEIESRERIEDKRLQLEREKLQAQILLESEKMGHVENVKQLAEELALIKLQIGQQHAMQMKDADRQHQAQMQQAQQQHEAQESAQQEQAEQAAGDTEQETA